VARRAATRPHALAGTRSHARRRRARGRSRARPGGAGRGGRSVARLRQPRAARDRWAQLRHEGATASRRRREVEPPRRHRVVHGEVTGTRLLAARRARGLLVGRGHRAVGTHRGGPRRPPGEGSPGRAAPGVHDRSARRILAARRVPPRRRQYARAHRGVVGNARERRRQRPRSSLRRRLDLGSHAGRGHRSAAGGDRAGGTGRRSALHRAARRPPPVDRQRGAASRHRSGRDDAVREGRSVA
jgi:hypothetical protein